MRKKVYLITGANGEIGHGLIEYFGKNSDASIIALDVVPLDETLKPYCTRFIQGDILDEMLLGRLVSEFEIRTIFHLASILSTKAEYNPETAHRVNVEGTLKLLRLAMEQSAWQGRSVKFIYPSSIASYGFASLEEKRSAGKIKECDFNNPITMYGCNKLYCEHLGCYYSQHYRQLAADRGISRVDFRCLRFPGLISAVTVPTGGTSDYGPEMLHSAAQRIPYSCFVRPDTQLPFMVMPDAIKSLLMIESVPRDKLKQLVYNVTSFSPSAKDFYDVIMQYYPAAEITFEPHSSRQGIVDSWPADLDDSAAREDWGWAPDFDQKRSFEEYLLPAIQAKYKEM